MFDCDHAVHGRVSAEIARKYLLKSAYHPHFVERVAVAIEQHGLDFDTLSPEEMGAQFSPEGKILIEADILDKLGASAITDALLLLGREGRLTHECGVLLSQGRTMERAVYFKPYLWSATGRQMADQRMGFFMAYLAQLDEEVTDERSNAAAQQLARLCEKSGRWGPVP